MRLKDWIDYAFKVGYVAGLVFFMYLKAWMQNNFAGKDEVKANGERIDQLERSVIVIVEKNKVDERQDLSLKDHEARLRLIEKVIK